MIAALSPEEANPESTAGSLRTVDALIPGVETSAVVTYATERCSKKEFTFSLQDEKLFKASCSTLIGRSDFDIIDLRVNECVAHLKIEDGKQMYILLGKDGSEWAKAKVSHPGGNTWIPRQMQFQGTSPNGGVIKLKSKKLEVGQNRERGLFFGGKLVVSSVKNAILIDQSTMKESIGIRKIAKNILELDAHREILPMHAFAIGLAAWMGPS